MTKPQALKLIDNLLNIFRDEWEGTQRYADEREEYEKMRSYIERKLNE